MKKIEFPENTPLNLSAYDFKDLDMYISYVEWLAKRKKPNEDENKNLNLDYYEWKDLLDDYDAR